MRATLCDNQVLKISYLSSVLLSLCAACVLGPLFFVAYGHISNATVMCFTVRMQTTYKAVGNDYIVTQTSIIIIIIILIILASRPSSLHSMRDIKHASNEL